MGEATFLVIFISSIFVIAGAFKVFKVDEEKINEWVVSKIN